VPAEVPVAGEGEVPKVIAPVLVFAYGNPSRGDDALGPALLDRLGESVTGTEYVELLTDFQLQVEHTLDVAGRKRVAFVDASVSCIEPFSWTRLAPLRDASYSSHIMSPAALLQAFVDVVGGDPPPCYLLTIRGYDFELGEPLSSRARSNLDAAVLFLGTWIAEDLESLARGMTSTTDTAPRRGA
jgi:hydrogenase maturation protease